MSEKRFPKLVQYMRLKGHERPVEAVDVDGSGKVALSVSEERVIQWDLLEGTGRVLMDDHPYRHWSATVSRDGSMGLTTAHSAGEKDYPLIWDLRRKELKGKVHSFHNWNRTLALHPNNRYAIGGCYDMSLFLYDLHDRKNNRLLPEHNSWINSVDFNHDGSLFLSAGGSGRDFNVRLWDFNQKKCLVAFLGHKDAISRVIFSPDGKFAVSADCTGKIISWDIEKKKMHRQICESGSRVLSLTFFSTNDYFYSGNEAGKLTCWSLFEDQPFVAENDLSTPVKGICYIPATGKLAATGSDNDLLLFNSILTPLVRWRCPPPYYCIENRTKIIWDLVLVEKIDSCVSHVVGSHPAKPENRELLTLWQNVRSSYMSGGCEAKVLNSFYGFIQSAKRGQRLL